MTEIIVCTVASLLAGFSTGFAGLSAAAFIAPMLVVFLGLDSFSAVGIALASDVLASGASAITYYRHGNIEIKKCRLLMAIVLLFAIIGSIASHIFTSFTIGEGIMQWWLILGVFGLGLKLLFFPAKTEKEKKPINAPDSVIMTLAGAYIGFVCGFQGTGGGLMLLFTLNILLRVDFKKSVGTSVLIMAFTAFIGAISHFTLRGWPDLKLLILCMLITFIGAEIAAIIANRVKPVTLKRLTGAMMTFSTIIMVISKLA